MLGMINFLNILLVSSFLFQQLEGFIPGQDYPVYAEVPTGLQFRCDQKLPGYYSDPDAQCQVITNRSCQTY